MASYSYKSGGILSHYIRDYANDNVSSLSSEIVARFLFKQSQTQRISDVNYGTVSDFGSTGVSIDNTAVLIVGEEYPKFVGAAGIVTNIYAPPVNVSVIGTGSFKKFVNADVSRTYVYEPSIIDFYSEIDYGTLSFNPTPVTTTETIDVDSLNATLSNTILSDTGTGIPFDPKKPLTFFIFFII